MTHLCIRETFVTTIHEELQWKKENNSNELESPQELMIDPLHGWLQFILTYEILLQESESDLCICRI